MNDKTAFLIWSTLLLKVALDGCVEADCGPPRQIQQLWKDKSSPDTVLRTTVRSVNESDAGLGCSQKSPRGLLQVEEVFRGNVAVGDLLPVYYATDTGWDSYDIPQNLVNSGDDGFVAFLRSNNITCNVTVYTLNECLDSPSWDNVEQSDREFLRNQTDAPSGSPDGGTGNQTDPPSSSPGAGGNQTDAPSGSPGAGGNQTDAPSGSPGAGGNQTDVPGSSGPGGNYLSAIWALVMALLSIITMLG